MGSLATITFSLSTSCDIWHRPVVYPASPPAPRGWHGLCLMKLLDPQAASRCHSPGGPMRSFAKSLILAPALALAVACNKDKPADPTLNQDLGLAAQANQNRQDSVT